MCVNPVTWTKLSVVETAVQHSSSDATSRKLELCGGGQRQTVVGIGDEVGSPEGGRRRQGNQEQNNNSPHADDCRGARE